jgi:hypothetical protein
MPVFLRAFARVLEYTSLQVLKSQTFSPRHDDTTFDYIKTPGSQLPGVLFLQFR